MSQAITPSTRAVVRTGEVKVLNTVKFGKRWFKLTTSKGRGLFTPEFQYDLPSKGKKGAWQEFKGYPMMCVKGFHVTQTPSRWTGGSRTCRLFEVDVEGFPMRQQDTYEVSRPVKAVCRRMRLAREIKRGSVEWKKIMTRSAY